MTAKLSDRELIELAKEELGEMEFTIWLWKTYGGMGSRTGAEMLGITREAWRYRLAEAERKLRAVAKDTAA